MKVALNQFYYNLVYCLIEFKFIKHLWSDHNLSIESQDVLIVKQFSHVNLTRCDSRKKKVYNIKAADTINVRDLVSSEERRKRPLLAEVLRKTVGGCERDSMGGWDFDGWKGEEGSMQVRRKVQKRPQTRMNITQSGNRKKTNLVGTKCSYS